MPVTALKRRLLIIYAVLLAGSVALVARLYFLGREVASAHAETGSRIGEIAELTGLYLAALLFAALLAGRAFLARRANEHRIMDEARLDPITRLPSRIIFEREVGQLIGAPFGLLLFGIDQFKQVLGGMGYAAGDELLKLVAERIRSALPNQCMNDSCTLYRFEGVAFGVLLPDAENDEDLERLASQVLKALEQPFVVANREIFVALSCGAALHPRDGDAGMTLVRNAGTAMQTARSAGGRTFRIFDESMNGRALERLAMENELRRAIERNELQLHYQPQADLRTGELVGAEALLRWKHDGRLISPVAFIPMAEESGLIIPIGTWVLMEACRQARTWREDGLALPCVAVNISARQFQQPDFVPMVDAIIQETGLPPEALELEITEGAAVRDIEHAIATIYALKQIGVRLSIDDFGTGYSSLSYLKRFDIDKLKVDQSFIRSIPSDSRDSAISGILVRLGHSLALTVIAEGVETEDQLEFLRRSGCDEMQGYLLSRPVPPAEFERFLRERGERPLPPAK